jgi:hypothetical protein
MSGWIKLHRKINEHWLWSNSDYVKWWIDILLEVNYTDQSVLIGSTLHECKRGEKLYSLDTWAKRWKTNKSAVRRFLNLLQNDSMIVLKSETQTTRLTVCKYDSYQDERNEDETQMKRKRNANETQMTPIKEREEIEEGKEKDIPQKIAANNPDSSSSDIEKIIGYYNMIHVKSYKPIPTRIDAIKYWLKHYTPKEICKAIKAAKYSSSFTAKVASESIETLFRKRNKNGSVDYIGELLNEVVTPQKKYKSYEVLSKEVIEDLNKKYNLPLDWNDYDQMSKSLALKSRLSINEVIEMY